VRIIFARHFKWRNNIIAPQQGARAKKAWQNELNTVTQTVNKLADVLQSMLRDRTRYLQVHDALHLLMADQKQA
jgi:hypothetical protein